MRGLKSIQSAKVILGGSIIHYNFFGSHVTLNDKTPARVAGIRLPFQICRRYNISFSVLYHWKRQYRRGKFNNELTVEAALKDKIEKLERLVGRLTLENEFLKGAYSTVEVSPKETGNRHAVKHFPAASDGGAD